MKSLILFIILLLVSSIAYGQSSIVFDAGTHIEVTTGADMCADNVTINGTYSGSGTLCDEPLPVELTSFTATVKSNAVNLKWETETEVDNYGFDVERCVSNYEWEKIGFVEGHGNSNSPKFYSFIDKNPMGGCKFQYRLKQIDTDGKYEYSDVVEVEIVPMEFALYQNYPNPFNPSTTIRYSLPNTSSVEIFVFNTIGEMIEREIVENQETGNYEWIFVGNDLSSGTYFYKLQAGSFVETKKMLLLK